MSRSKYKTRAEKAAEAAAKAPPPSVTDQVAEEARQLGEYIAISGAAESIALRGLNTFQKARSDVPGALVAGHLKAITRFTLDHIPPPPGEVYTATSLALMLAGAIERAAAEMLDERDKADPANVN